MKLFIRLPGGKTREFTLERRGYLVGRGDNCDIVIPDRRVSSRHLFLTPRGEEWWVRDLGSTNGTFINGKKVRVARLKPGDTLQIGHTVIVLEEKERGVHREYTTLHTTRLEDILTPPRTLGEARRLHRHLEVLYQVTLLLHSLQTLDDALKKCLDLLFRVLRAERGVIFLEKEGKLEKVAERLVEKALATYPISRSMVEEVFQKGESIITSDAMGDARFMDRKSVLASHIRSAMCVPLTGKEGSLGVIYVDTLLSRGAFGEEDLELLTIIGHQAGMAIENSRLYEENLRKERLAGIGMAVAGMAHYIKNIIQGLKSGETVIDLALNRKKFQLLSQGWTAVKRSINRVEELVLNMLSYSREKRIEKREVSLNSLLEEVVELFKERAREKKVRLKFLPDPQVKSIYADPLGIHRAVTNMVTNALEAVGERGEIIVSSQRVPGGVEVRIKDDGKGISPDILPRIFQPFYTEKEGRGTGLGLAVTRKIIQEHEGKIEVDSQPGKGTEFRIFLPFS